MKKLIHILCFSVVFGQFLFTSCEKEEPEGPPKAGIFYSIAGKQVAFTAMTKRVVSWDWEFGDGTTGTGENPVHVYTDGGYYTVTLTGKSGSGVAVYDTVDIAVALTPYVLLTGGPTAVNGKTWKMTANHTTNDKLVNADATFSLADPDIPSLPVGAFALYLGMAEVYEDEFTFYYNGKYSHNVKADNASLSGLVYQMLTTGGAGIVDDDGAEFGLCTASYAPQAGATFTYTGEEDFTVPSVYGPGGKLVFNDVTTLSFSGTEFVGLMENTRKVIVQDITDSSMRLVMFYCAAPKYYPLNTHALILTFEVVD